MPIQNFVFSGGGVLGIAYLGLLKYLYQISLAPSLKRVAGTSAGAITACLFSFNLPYNEIRRISESLDYTLVPGTDEVNELRKLNRYDRIKMNKIFDNLDCIYRLISNYGWFSSSYFYEWLKTQIASQFNSAKKAPPYTFADFKEPSLHLENRPFKDLYIVGTNVSDSKKIIFSAETTPDIEVAEAVRISMSVPLFFESVKSSCVYCDGGLLNNYPITLFDEMGPPEETLGAMFSGDFPPNSVNNIIDYITHIINCFSSLQHQLYLCKQENASRTIQILTSDVSSLNFNIQTGDETYRFLFEQGYRCTETYFALLKDLNKY